MNNRFVIMGVSGCGKTSVGEMLAEQCDLTFVDGDDLHPQANVDRMSQGIPLDDADRQPWLRDVGRTLNAADGSVAIGCSALKRDYRDWIRAEVQGPVHFLHLHAAKEVLEERVSNRPGHFMPASLLDSQFAALEHLQDDESGQVIEISAPLPEVVTKAKAYIQGFMT